jgi:hypothetical protein
MAIPKVIMRAKATIRGVRIHFNCNEGLREEQQRPDSFLVEEDDINISLLQ